MGKFSKNEVLKACPDLFLDGFKLGDLFVLCLLFDIFKPFIVLDRLSCFSKDSIFFFNKFISASLAFTSLIIDM